MDVIKLILVYFSVINLVGFAVMGIDKWKAQKRLFRIPEAVLFLFALFGGCIGSILGMFLFHHKTRHWYFRYGLPLLLFLQLIILYLIWRAPIEFSIL